MEQEESLHSSLDCAINQLATEERRRDHVRIFTHAEKVGYIFMMNLASQAGSSSYFKEMIETTGLGWDLCMHVNYSTEMSESWNLMRY